MKKNHVVIIGGGVAGCVAATAALERGAEVTLVARGVGATALSSGGVTLDGIGSVPAEESEREKAVSLLEKMACLQGDARSARTYLVNTGAVIEAHFVGPMHAEGALEELHGKSVLVVGIRGLASMSPADLAKRLEARGVRKARGTLVDVSGLRRTFDLTHFPLARAIDDTDTAESFVAAVADEAAKADWDLVALPPVLGLEKWKETAQIFDNVLGRSWFELLSAPPSVPGLRLHRALLEHAASAGAKILHADVKGARLEGDRIVEIKAWEGEVSHTLEPDEVVLATGRFIGGGIMLEGSGAGGAVETLLGLSATMDADRGGGDELLGAGVATDDELRPVDGGGSVVLANLRAAGAVRACGSYAAAKGGLGTAALLGYRAGVLASTAAGVEKPRPVGEAKERTVTALPRAGQEGCLGCEVCASVCPVLGESLRVGTWYPGPRTVGGLSRSGPLLEAGAEPLSLCTLCGACSSICPAGVSNHETVASLRARLMAEYPDAAPEAYDAMPSMLKKYGNVYGVKLEPIRGPRRNDAQIAFFPGCAMSYFERDSAERTVKLFEALGIPFSVVDGVCCGGPLDVLGLKPPPDLIEKNREAVKATGASVVTAACPRCAHRLSSDLDLEGVRVEHTLETLERILPDIPGELIGRIRRKLGRMKVTYHDPCELGRYLGKYENARRVLALAGVKLIEMPHTRERSVCCGAGGGLRSVNTKLSREIARSRVAEAMETGAKVILTECPSCLHNLRTGRKRKQLIKVEDVTALLGGALED